MGILISYSLRCQIKVKTFSLWSFQHQNPRSQSDSTGILPFVLTHTADCFHAGVPIPIPHIPTKAHIYARTQLLSCFPDAHVRCTPSSAATNPKNVIFTAIPSASSSVMPGSCRWTLFRIVATSAFDRSWWAQRHLAHRTISLTAHKTPLRIRVKLNSRKIGMSIRIPTHMKIILERRVDLARAPAR